MWMLQVTNSRTATVQHNSTNYMSVSVTRVRATMSEVHHALSETVCEWESTRVISRE